MRQAILHLCCLERCSKSLSLELLCFNKGQFRLKRGRIATMSKPAESILSCDGGQNLSKSFPQSILGSCSKTTEGRFELGERLLNGREIGRVRRQKQEAASASFDTLLNTFPQMNTQVIHNNNLSALKIWCKDLLDIQFKSTCISRSLQNERFAHPGQREGSDQCGVLAVVARNLPNRSFPF